jgi:CBS domain-containing protein
MAGYTRMTYSLGVIIMETSQDLSIFVPIIFSIIISNQVGFKFTRSLYQRATRSKQMPIIADRVPPPCKNLKAGDLMQPNPITVFSVDSMDNVRMSIANNNHHSFPVVNSEN